MNPYSQEEVDRINKVKETNDRLEEFFNDKRAEWNKTVEPLFKVLTVDLSNPSNSKKILEAQSLALTHRQQINEQINFFLNKRSKETKKLNKPASASVVSVESDSVAVEAIAPDPQLDSETAERRSRARLALDEELKDRGNPPINPNLKEWAVIMRSNGHHGALETALDYTAYGYELPDRGNWRTGSANIDPVLIKLERGN